MYIDTYKEHCEQILRKTVYAKRERERDRERERER